MEDQNKQTSNQQSTPAPVTPAPSVAAAPAPSGEKPWYQKWWGIVILVLIAGPLGAIALYLIWVKANWNKTLKWIVSAVVVLFMWYLQSLLVKG